TKFALTVHDLSFVLLPETYSLRRQLWHKAVRAVELMKRADVLLAVSETTKRDLITTLEIPEERIAVVPHGVPTLAATEEQPSEWKWDASEPFLLSVSTIEPRKNLLALLQAYERLVEREAIPHKLVLAGGWGWKSSELREALRRSPVADRVCVTGYVSEAEKTWLLTRATLVAFPSLYEGFGLPPLEAFQARTPVLASSTAAVAETVGDAGLLVNPYDVGELTFGLSQLLHDPLLREEFVRRGEERLNQFSWKASARRALQAFSEMTLTERV
ncbi:MAG: glycosyltransferase family 4 protein, partial [Candidatus Andersenbacteria bacterium]|nr:glycosyltransferase family 4 protein [Candidatus Andersenbacteria bacterium]